MRSWRRQISLISYTWSVSIDLAGTLNICFVEYEFRRLREHVRFRQSWSWLADASSLFNLLLFIMLSLFWFFSFIAVSSSVISEARNGVFCNVFFLQYKTFLFSADWCGLLPPDSGSFDQLSILGTILILMRKKRSWVFVVVAPSVLSCRFWIVRKDRRVSCCERETTPKSRKQNQYRYDSSKSSDKCRNGWCSAPKFGESDSTYRGRETQEENAE